MQLAEKLDEMAGETGVGRRQRNHMRRTVSHLQWRLQRQPLELVLDEMLTKTQRRMASLAEHSDNAFLNLEGVGGLEEWLEHREEFEREFLMKAPQSDFDPQTGRLTYTALKRRAQWRLRQAGIYALIGIGLVGVGAALSDGAGAVLILVGLFPLTAATVFFFMAIVTYLLVAERKISGTDYDPEDAPQPPPQPAQPPPAPEPAPATNEAADEALRKAQEALKAAEEARKKAEAGEEGADEAMKAAEDALKEAQEAMEKAAEE